MKHAALVLLCVLVQPAARGFVVPSPPFVGGHVTSVASSSAAPAAAAAAGPFCDPTSPPHQATRAAGRRRSRPGHHALVLPCRATTLPQDQGGEGEGEEEEEEEEEEEVVVDRPKKPILTTLVELLASKLVRKTARRVSGLDIDVGARSNGDVLAGNLPRVKAKFNRIVLESIQVSGGGRMEITGLNIRLLALLLARRLSVIRRPFEIFGQYVLTQQDVSASKLIRDMIQLLVNNVLRTLFPSLHLTFFDVSIDHVRISNQKLAILGTANIAESDGGMPFTLLTGVGLAGDGHIVYLDNPELVLNPDAPLPVKVPLGSIRAFDVDIGDNARIERIEIDDRLGVSITARTLITPAPPFQVTNVGKRAAFLYDLGAFFSSFFGFTHFSELNLEG